MFRNSIPIIGMTTAGALLFICLRTTSDRMLMLQLSPFGPADPGPTTLQYYEL